MADPFTSLSSWLTVAPSAWTKPMRPNQVHEVAKAAVSDSEDEQIQSVITASINNAMVHFHSFDRAEEKPFERTWTVFGASDASWPKGHSPKIFEKVVKEFREAGYEASFGPSQKYPEPETYDLTIREPRDGG